MDKEKCPSCGAPLEPGAKFCWRCGTRLEPSKGRSKSISNQKERTSILELNDVKKQLDELKKRLDEITPILQQLSKTKENVSASQGSVATPVPQTPKLTPEQLEQLASKYEVSPEVFEKMPEKGLKEFGEKLLLLAQYSAEGIIDIGELIKYERSKNKDPRVYLPLIEVARKSDYLHEPSPDGKGFIPKVPLLPFEEITWREWSRKYIEKYGCYTGPLEKAYRFMAPTK
jgi:uncharacterized Zn finger protein (UPF0148 family)